MARAYAPVLDEVVADGSNGCVGSLAASGTIFDLFLLKIKTPSKQKIVASPVVGGRGTTAVLGANSIKFL